MKKLIGLCIISCMTVALHAALSGPGDIAFIGFNADGDDDFAIVLFADADAGQLVEFCDEEWNGTSFASASSEGDMRWLVPAGGISAGTVVVFNNISGTPSASVGSVDGGGINLSASGETLYSYLGTNRTPTAFLGIISTKIEDYNGTSGSLNGTGCTQGQEAILLDEGTDGAEYAGTRSGRATYAEYLPPLNAVSNTWTIEMSDGTLLLPFDTTPFTLAGSVVPTNTVALTAPVPPPVITAAPNTAIACEMTSELNGTMSIGYGQTTNGFGWTWVPAGLSGTSPFTATNTISPAIPGTYYYVAKWNDGPFTYYGWNTAGQQNETVLVPEFMLVITNPVQLPPLVITEVMSSSAHPGGYVNGDWFELYNAGDTAIDLTGYSWDDDSAVPGTVVIPTGIVIEARSTLIISEETVGQENAFITAWDMITHTTHTNMLNMGGSVPGLSSGGDEVHFYTPMNVEVTTVSFGAAIEGMSFEWDANGVSLDISEEGVNGAWRASGDGAGGSGVDIGSPGVVLTYDDVIVPTNVVAMISPVSPPVITAAPNTVIACEMTSLSNGTLSIGYGETADGAGWTWVPAAISSGPAPYTATNSIAPAMPGTYYYAAKWNDGPFTYYGWNTAGQQNETALSAEYMLVITNPVFVPPLVITEVMSNSANTNNTVNGDWFEIYNAGDEAIDLTGYSWDDDSEASGTAVFPSNTVIEAHSTLIVSEETVEQEALFIAAWDIAGHGGCTNVLHMGGTVPGLSSGGDGVFLYTPAGVEITSATFGGSTDGFSFEWDIYGDSLGLSEDGVNGAWLQPGNGVDIPGMDVGSPGVVVPEPALVSVLGLLMALLVCRKK